MWKTEKIYENQKGNMMELSYFALIGAPNCGKTVLFNGLTGSHAKVANYPGVTVDKREGAFLDDEAADSTNSTARRGNAVLV